MPLGVCFIIYEAGRTSRSTPPRCASRAATRRSCAAARRRPTPTRSCTDVAARGALEPACRPTPCSSSPTTDRDELGELLRDARPHRPGDPARRRGLIRRVAARRRRASRSIYAAGNCHVYVDADADLDMAVRIVVNAKAQRPGVCNAAETLLVHARVAAAFLPRSLAELCRRRRRAARRRAARAIAGDDAGRPADERRLRDRVPRPDAGGRASSTRSTTRSTTSTGYGSGHSEAIVTDVAGGGRPVHARGRRGLRATSTRRPGSPTAASSASAPRSATRRRGCTSAARSACVS